MYLVILPFSKGWDSKPKYIYIYIYTHTHKHGIFTIFSEKYKTIQPLKLLFLQNIPICSYTHLSESVKFLETFLEATLWETFQVILLILNYVCSFTKQQPLQCWFNSKEQVKVDWMQVRRVWGRYSVVTFFFAKKFLTITDRCAGAFSW